MGHQEVENMAYQSRQYDCCYGSCGLKGRKRNNLRADITSRGKSTVHKAGQCVWATGERGTTLEGLKVKAEI